MKTFFEPFKDSFIMKVITAIIAFLLSFSGLAQSNNIEIPAYKPRNQKLYTKIVSLDSIYFNAYNTCDMKKQGEMYSEEIEFFHDKGGLSDSKQEILKSIKKNICNKVTRTLVAGSIEVYEIPDYGAIEMGYHTFYNKEEPDAKQTPTRFIIVWKKGEKKWKIKKVISLH